MDTANIQGKAREKTTKGSLHNIRKEHFVPGVLYGKNISNMLVEFSDMELNDVLKKHGEHAVVNVNINGSDIKTMIKEVQREPVNRQVTHIDLKLIKDDERVHADIPVVIKGEEKVRSNGGVLQKQSSYLTVETTPDKLPKFITADVSALRIGDKLTVRDVEMSGDIMVISDINTIIAMVTDSKENDTTEEELVEKENVSDITNE